MYSSKLLSYIVPRFDTHTHNEISNMRFKDSIIKVEDLINRAIELGLKGIAITDHEALCSHPRAIKHLEGLKKKNPDLDFRLVLGNEIYLVDERKPNQVYYHFILIAKNKDGYKALKELSSHSWLQSYVDRNMERVPTTKEELIKIVKKYPNSLIATSACLGGELAKSITGAKEAKEKEDNDTFAKCNKQMHDFVCLMKRLFRDDFYMEVAPAQSEEQLYFNRALAKISTHYNCKIVIGTDAHYLNKEDAFIHESYLRSKEAEREVLSFYQYAYLQPQDDIIVNLKGTGLNYEELCDNSIEILNKIEDFNIDHSPVIPKIKVHDYPKTTKDYWLKVINDVSHTEYPYIYELLVSDEIQERYYINEVLKGLEMKGKLTLPYIKRVEEECDILRDLSTKLNDCLHAYSNTLQHYIDLFWECGSIVGTGRGSAAGWMGNYAMGITQLDPLEYKLYHWRFLNKERPELPDVDLDLAPSTRNRILNAIRKENHDRIIGEEIDKENLGVTLVATFGTETTKSVIHTACSGYKTEEYPNGINNDDADYLASLIPEERGKVWELNDVINGNEEKGRRPITTFIKEVSKYPNLLDIMVKLEGLISKRGTHASGVILFDGDPYDNCCFMKSPKGDICTQWDLHDAEWCGNVKYDFLLTEITDKFIEFTNILKDEGIWDSNASQRELYNKYLHPDVLPLSNTDIWDALAEGTVIDCFQFSTPLGLTSAKKCHVNNIMEMADLTSVMRLIINPNKENPVDRYMRIKNDPSLWYKECRDCGLTEEEISRLEPHFTPSFGNIVQQEQLMVLFMEISHFTLGEANWGRSVVSKKKVKDIPKLKKMVIDGMDGEREEFKLYVWTYGVEPLLGYGFPLAHAAAYSLIGVQSLVCGVLYPEVYWDTACLRINSKSTEDEEDSYDYRYKLDKEDDSEEDIDDSEEDNKEVKKKEKKQKKTGDYDKVGIAIRDMQLRGVNISFVDINKSKFTFTPDAKNNRILYGLNCLPNINNQFTDIIIKNRPYTSLNNFLNRLGGNPQREKEIESEYKKKVTTEDQKVILLSERNDIKANKLPNEVIITLIKAGAFNNLEEQDTINQMIRYCKFLYIPKTKMMSDYIDVMVRSNILPKNQFNNEIRIWYFKKYLMNNNKTSIKDEDNKNIVLFKLYGESLTFYNEFFDTDLLITKNNSFFIKKDLKDGFDYQYNKLIKPLSDFIKENKDELLEKINEVFLKKSFIKLCKGNYNKSSWEMETMCFYYSDHELLNVNTKDYGISDFNLMPTEPKVASYFTKGDKQIPLYDIELIAGTVIAKNKNRSYVTLSTVTGIVNIKVNKELFSTYNKRISQLQPNGKKKVIEESWFKRGSLLLVAGYRNGADFRCKTYKNTKYHHIQKITKIDKNNRLILQSNRKGA